MERWSDDRVWEAVDAWRWVPPAAKRVVEPCFELAVTPGSYALTYAYGIHAKDDADAERVLGLLRQRVAELGGTGVRVQVLARAQPENLPAKLVHAGFHVLEEAEALAWELLDEFDRPRMPDFRAARGVEVKEALTDSEYRGFLSLSGPIFGDPDPSASTLRAFREAFHQQVRDTHHSDRYVAWKGGLPVGRAGMEVVEEVARLWGTGVLPEHRQHGIYGQMVLARCQEAVRRGAKLALVTARIGTSGPILRHHGFRSVGTMQMYETRWTAPNGGPGLAVASTNP